MAFLDDLKKFGKNVAQKSTEMVEVTKLNLAIGQEKDKIAKLYKEIGQAVFEAYKNGDDKGYGEKCEAIKEIEAKIEELQAKILEIKNASKCPKCGAEIQEGQVFCPKCGAKVGS